MLQLRHFDYETLNPVGVFQFEDSERPAELPETWVVIR